MKFLVKSKNNRVCKVKWSRNFLLSFFTIFLIMALVSPASYAHYDTAYWNDGTLAQNKPSWMASLDDSRRLSELSLPGTHDTMAHKSNLLGLDITRTQTMNLQQQLQSGIRVLDIRLYYNSSNEFTIHHGSVYTGYNFDDVMTTVKQFLAENPSEVVLMRLKQEQSSASNAEMKTLFDRYYDQYNEVFYQGGSQNPTVGETRGKCVILSDVLSLNQYGINYRNLKVQDNYHLNTNWDLYSKWEKVKEHIIKANNSDSSDIYMNYLNGSGGSFPYFVASGHSSPGTSASRLATGLTEPGFSSYYPDFPRVARLGVFATIAFEGTNTLTADYLTNNNISYCGIIMADFPGERLINSVINRNSLSVSNSPAVTLYADSNLKGNSVDLSEGKSMFYNWKPVGNDTVSSVKVSPGYQVTLYEHADYTGKSLTLNASSNWVGDNYNDLFSSAIVKRLEPAVTLYADSYFKGNSVDLYEGKSTFSDWKPVENDTISSVKVTPGYQITLYEHADYTGKSLTLNASSNWVGDNYNDLFSSAIIKKI